VLSRKGVDRKILGEKGQKENQDRETALISLPPFYQWRAKRHTGQWACILDSPQGNAAPRTPRKK